MSYITVKFIDKEYSIPQDVLIYIDLLSFTEDVKNQLVGAFVQKVTNEIIRGDTGLLDDKDLAAEIEQQVGKFISKLCDNGIFTRTITDYLKNNKGYQLYSDVNKAALEKMKSLLIQEMEDWKAGYENAVNNAESHVTGMGFSIWSSSFVNHAIYAAMESSKLKEQSKEAEAQYQKDMSDLRSRLDSQYGGEKSNYINNTYIPSMEAALTVFAYELLDKYISDLIAHDRFDGKTLDYVDIGRSNDLLKNLTLSNNKKAILENAFVACPYNIAVYMQAMKMEVLDGDTFETANIFKQGAKIISFLKESMGSANYPNFTEPNYYSASLLARYTNTSVNDVLYQHTASYANAVIKEYGEIVKALDNSNLCREYLRKLSDDEILSGEGTSKHLANSLVYSIATNDNWNILVERCGHADLLEKLQSIMPTGLSCGSKADCDSYLVKALFKALEAVRKDLAQKISESRARAEAERQKLEAQKRKKRIKTTAIVCAIIAVVIFVISLPTIIENAKIAKRESYVEKQIQEVVMPLERQMEDATGVDIIIDYSFSLENDWDTEQWYEWDFCVRIPIFEDYRKSNSKNEQDLLIIMDVCKILEDIYQDTLDDLRLNDLQYDGARVVLDYSGGELLDIRDLSTYETFYYEEHSGNRYLHSFNSEYVLDINVQSNQAKEYAYNKALALMSAQKYDEAIEIFAKLSGYKDSDEKIILAKSTMLKNAKIGGSIFFGEYEQDNNLSNGAEIIEWIVLDKQDNKLLVISKNALDNQPFNVNYTDITWEKCTLRSWLNGEFIDTAFSADERSMIPTVVVSADENPDYATHSGNSTLDQIFLLSIDEADNYFNSNRARQCIATDYAIAKGATLRESFGSPWWLRTTRKEYDSILGKESYLAAGIMVGGEINEDGWSVNLDVPVRPAMWIDVSE